MANLPAVGVVDVWATLLNAFLCVAHEISGTNGGKIKKSAVFNDVAVRTITASGNILVTDYNVLINATTSSIIVTLPSAALLIEEIRIKRIDSGINTVTINTTGSQTIDGELFLDIMLQYETITIISDGVQFWKI